MAGHAVCQLLLSQGHLSLGRRVRVVHELGSRLGQLTHLGDDGRTLRCPELLLRLQALRPLAQLPAGVQIVCRTEHVHCTIDEQTAWASIEGAREVAQ